MSILHPSAAELRAGLSLRTTERHRIVVQRTFVEALVVSARGKPVPDLLCEVTLPNGSKRRAFTDGEGRVRFDATPQEGEARLRIPEQDRLDAPEAPRAGNDRPAR